MELVAFEKTMLEFKKEGYEIELVVDDNCVNKNGRIVDCVSKNSFSYKIRTYFNGNVEELEKTIEFSE